MNDLVRRENSGGAAILTLNRPEKLNALTKEMFEALDKHINAIARESRKVGLVILRGAGAHFSAGYDMDEVLEHVRAHAKPHFHSEVIQKLADLPQPVISAVQGHCSTGALELALAADLIVAAESARFSDVYARWGLTPVWGLSLRLPHRIGWAKASEMMLTCRSYTGLEAQAMHLADGRAGFLDAVIRFRVVEQVCARAKIAAGLAARAGYPVAKILQLLGKVFSGHIKTRSV